LPDSALFLGAFAVETSSALLADQLLLRTGYTGTSLGQLESRQLLLRRDGGELLVRASSAYPTVSAPASAQERRCSFLIDCDDDAVKALLVELRAQNRTSVRGVIDYVHDFISDKRLSRRFDIASVVARNREGDCTEHAVLTAALLRGVGVPSRVVLGLVLTEAEGQRMAFGHAWTEFQDGSHWQLADATKLEGMAARLVYVPLQNVSDDGPAFSRANFSGLQIVDVESLAAAPLP
jgi:transglutaminase-like putative cysteine protease